MEMDEKAFNAACRALDAMPSDAAGPGLDALTRAYAKCAIVTYDAELWRPIAEAPTDGTVVLVYAPSYEDLPSMITTAAYSEYAGWCVDELRTVTHFRALPPGLRS